MKGSEISIGIFHNNLLYREAMKIMIDQFENCKVEIQESRDQFFQNVVKNQLPEICLLHLHVPVSVDINFIQFLHTQNPEVKLIVITEACCEVYTLNLLENGVRAIIQHDISAKELKEIIFNVYQTGYHLTSTTTRGILRSIASNLRSHNRYLDARLSANELLFLQLVTTDLTYKEIADQMKTSFRAVDKLRDRLFTRFAVKSRVGLSIVSLRNGLVSLEG